LQSADSQRVQRIYAVPLFDHERFCHGTNYVLLGLMMLLVTESEMAGQYKRLGLVSIALAGSFSLWREHGPSTLGPKNEYRRILVETIECMETHVITLV